MATNARPPRPGRPREGRPAAPAGNTLKIPISMTPADHADLEAFAREWAEPGMPPNRSGAWRRILREWRAFSRDGRVRPETPDG
jgi:hypothetical protein